MLVYGVKINAISNNTHILKTKPINASIYIDISLAFGLFCFLHSDTMLYLYIVK